MKFSKKKKFTDVIFIVEGKRIFAHKIILFQSDQGFKNILKGTSGIVLTWF